MRKQLPCARLIKLKSSVKAPKVSVLMRNILFNFLYICGFKVTIIFYTAINCQLLNFPVFIRKATHTQEYNFFLISIVISKLRVIVS